MNYTQALDIAVRAARTAGRMCLEAFHLPGGPAGRGQYAEVDAAAERAIRNVLAEHPAGWPVLGEELGGGRPSAHGHQWVVDPNDGTKDFLRGHRGSSVAIGLLRDGEPVLGVVFAYASPDSNGDLLAWAEGSGPLTRNGVPVERAALPESVDTTTIIALSQGAIDDSAVAANVRVCAPGRFLAVSGLAYRAARVAVGDADAAVSLGGASAWDLVAAHALLRAIGGDVFDRRGVPIRYGADGAFGWTFAGSHGMARELASRDWASVLARGPGLEVAPLRFGHTRPVPGLACDEPGRLARAHGCMLGQLAGDALGSLVEFQSGGAIRAAHPAGVRDMVDGGTWRTIAGQPTDDSEMALMLARSLADRSRYDADHVAASYAAWYRTEPFDVGNTTHNALSAAPLIDEGAADAVRAAAATRNAESQANGALMRVSPLGIFGHAMGAEQLAELARQDAQLTHPHGVCGAANAVFACSLAYAVRTGAPAADVAAFADERASTERCEPVARAIRKASAAPPDDFAHQQGWVLIALQNAFFQLLHAPSLEEGLVDTVGRGGDTDTNAAIAGALLGAVHGRDAVPQRWTRLVLTCRSSMELRHVQRPRPRMLWPTDALALAERLTVAAA